MVHPTHNRELTLKDAYRLARTIRNFIQDKKPENDKMEDLSAWNIAMESADMLLKRLEGLKS
jgi:hypothetical protein